MLQATLPYHENPPPLLLQLVDVPLITLDIFLEFLSPELCTCRRRRAVRTLIMAVPETTVNEDNGTISWQHNIGAAWKLAIVKGKSESEPMQRLSNAQLRGRILPSNTRHHSRPRLFAYDIHSDPWNCLHSLVCYHPRFGGFQEL